MQNAWRLDFAPYFLAITIVTSFMALRSTDATRKSKQICSRMQYVMLQQFQKYLVLSQTSVKDQAKLDPWGHCWISTELILSAGTAGFHNDFPKPTIVPVQMRSAGYSIFLNEPLKFVTSSSSGPPEIQPKNSETLKLNEISSFF